MTDWLRGTRSRRYCRWVSRRPLGPPARSAASWPRSLLELGLQVQHHLHAGQVQALGGELLDAAEQRDVLVAVATAAADGPGRVDQALALVDAKRLRVQPGQLGGHRDDVDGTRGRRVGHQPTPRCSRGDEPSDAAWRASTALRSRRSTASTGTATSTVASRSPGALRAGHAPALDPERAPAARAGRDPERDRRAVEGRHLDVRAERGLGERHGHGEGQVVAPRAKRGCEATRTTT